MGSKSKTLIIIVFLFSLLSCSNTNPVVMDIYPNIIHDIEKNHTYISVFGSFSSDPLRIKSMKLLNSQNNISWDVENINISKSDRNSQELVGFSAFVAPDTGFPQGIYQVVFYDEANRSTKKEFYIKEYVIFDNIDEITNKEEYIVIFNKDDNILGFEKQSIENVEEKQLMEKYKEAEYYKSLIKDLDNDIMYFLQKIYL